METTGISPHYICFVCHYLWLNPCVYEIPLKHLNTTKDALTSSFVTSFCKFSLSAWLVFSLLSLTAVFLLSAAHQFAAEQNEIQKNSTRTQLKKAISNSA